MAGVSVKADLPAGMDLSLDLLHDALNQIGGSEASLFLSRTVQAGVIRLTPNAGIKWTAARMANHDYGVSASEAIAGRPAYDTGDTLSPEAGIRLLAELSENWWIAASLSAEFLSRDVTDSPIVAESVLMKGFLAVQYVF
jgi:outer membrane protein